MDENEVKKPAGFGKNNIRNLVLKYINETPRNNTVSMLKELASGVTGKVPINREVQTSSKEDSQSR